MRQLQKLLHDSNVRRTEKEVKEISEVITYKNFPKLLTNTKPQVEEALRTK